MNARVFFLLLRFIDRSTVAIVLLASLLTTGCQSARTTRIHENFELFQSLEPGAQKLVEEGLVNYGFSSDLVVMALGKPDRMAAVDTASGRIDLWTYRNFIYASPRPVLSAANDQGGSPVPGAMVSSGTFDGPGRTSSGSFQPTVIVSIDIPLGTLVLGLRDDRVVTMRIDP